MTIRRTDPLFPDPDQSGWPVPLPGYPGDPMYPGVPGESTFGDTGQGGQGGAPIPSRTVSPIGTMPSTGPITGGSKLGTLAKVFGLGGKGKMDYTTLALGLASLFSRDGGQEREGFGRRSGDAITNTQQQIAEFGKQLSGRGPVKLRNPARRAEPVNIPGLGIQIGGGLGRDPATPPEEEYRMYGGDMDLSGMFPDANPPKAERRRPR